MTMTLEGFANSAAYQTQLENDKNAVSRLFEKIPKEFQGSVVFTTAEYNSFFVMGFRLTIDGNPFVALNSRHHPSVYSFELFHDGFRFVEPIYNPEGFSRRLAEEYNKNVIKNFQSFWKFAAIVFLFVSGIGLVAGSIAGGIIVALVLVLVGFIIASHDINKFDVRDVRLGVNTPLRESTLEALSEFHQGSEAK
jgi:hypothetical protein